MANRKQSALTALWLLLVTATLLHSAWALFEHGFSYRWLAPIIAASSILSFFGYRRLVGETASASAFPLVHATVALAPMLSLYALWLEEPEPLLPLLYAVVICYGGTLVYLRTQRQEPN